MYLLNVFYWIIQNQRVSNIESQLKFNIKDNNDADFKAQIEAIYLSLDNGGYDKPTPKEKIKALPSDVFNEIYSKVKEISGINDDFAQLEEDVEDFPENWWCSGNHSPWLLGLPISNFSKRFNLRSKIVHFER